ncbi:MAG: TIGR01212 family radical SAM protein, partial [Planctomycetes bacterium]|nr:TIGR01212 family radical SAM protein [Planctomycetota bacterium]
AQVHGIKFHQLMVLHRTQLAKQWLEGGIELLDAETYAQLVADAVEHLPPQMVVHRLVAEAPPEEYLAPKPWPGRGSVHSRIENILRERGTWQGKLHSGATV